MQIAVINLAAQADRWQQVRQRFHAVGLAPVRHEAVAGAALPAAQHAVLYDAALNRRQYHRVLRAGEIGCYASHLALWRQLVGSGAPHLAVFEDDVEPSAALPEVLNAIARLPPAWDMIKLVGRRREKVRAHRPLLPRHELIDYRRVPSFTSAYVVARRGAEKLLARRPPVGRPVDVDLRYWWECDLEILGVQPYPAQAADTSRHTTIHGRESRPDLAARLRKLRLQLQYTALNWHAARLRSADRRRTQALWPVPGRP
jgi:glycosyl transferase family 25